MDYAADIIIATTIIGGLACIVWAFIGDDNLDKPEWFDSTWF